MYSSSSETSLFLVSLLPTPLGAMFNQKRFKTEDLVRKLPNVDGPRQAAQKATQHPFGEKSVSLFLYMSGHEIRNILAIGISPNQNKH